MNTYRCVLGKMHELHLDEEPGPGVLPRQYFLCEFQPNAKCLTLMESAADGTEGVAGVMLTDKAFVGYNSVKTTFCLVLDRSIDVQGTIKEWLKKFRKELAAIPTEKHQDYTGGIKHADPLIATATHSAPTGTIDD